jgi:hypothetical protein
MPLLNEYLDQYQPGRQAILGALGRPPAENRHADLLLKLNPDAFQQPREVNPIREVGEFFSPPPDVWAAMNRLGELKAQGRLEEAENSPDQTTVWNWQLPLMLGLGVGGVGKKALTKGMSAAKKQAMQRSQQGMRINEMALQNDIRAGNVKPGDPMIDPSELGMAQPRVPGQETDMLSVGGTARPLGAAPDRTTFTYERHAAPKGTSARTTNLITRFEADPALKSRLVDTIRSGEEVGRRWYNTEPLRDRFIKVLGKKDGDAAWREYSFLLGATSPRSKVPANVRNASHYFVQGRERLKKIADDLRAGTVLPSKPYGHITQKMQARNVADYHTGGWDPKAVDPLLAPKPRGFGQSIIGGETNIAADAHFMRIVGMIADDPAFLSGSANISGALAKSLRAKFGKKVEPFLSERVVKGGAKQFNFNAKAAVDRGPKGVFEAIKKDAKVWGDMPGKNEYKALEEYVNKLAGELDMTAPQVQASLWVGAGERTGVDPTSLGTLMDTFERNLAARAAERGQTVGETFSKFAKRVQPLAVPAFAAPGLLGGMMAEEGR